MKKYLIFATIVAMVFVGCKKNTTAPPKKPADNRVAAQLSGKILKDDVKTTTRVTYDGQWEGAEKIGIFMLPSGSKEIATSFTNNSKFSCSKTGAMTPEGEKIYFPSNDTEVDFIAYHPHNTEFNSKNVGFLPTTPVNFSEQKDLTALEFLWSFVPKQSAKSPAIQFPFRRLQSSMQIVLVSNARYISDEVLKGTKITIEAFPVMATFDVMNGALINPKGPIDLQLERNLVYLPPHTNENFSNRKIVVEMPYKGKTLSYIAPITFEMVAGKTHKVTIKLGDESGELAVSSTIEPWWAGKRQDDIHPVRVR